MISGLMYGLYTTFVLIAGYYKPLAGAVGLFAAPYVTSGLNDLFAGIWLTAYNVKTGRIREIGRSLRLFPGKIILIGSLVGGPIASGAYLMGLAWQELTQYRFPPCTYSLEHCLQGFS